MDIEYRRPGYLYLARTAETAESIRRNLEVHDRYDVPSRYVTPAEAAELCPGLDTDRYVGGSFCPTDGYADTARALQGFAIAASRAGASFRVGRPVTAIRSTNDRFVVQTAGDTFDADYVVNAAGAWSAQVAAMVGIDLAVTPSRRQLLVAEPTEPFDTGLPFVTDLDSGSYFRRRDAATAFVGGHFESESETTDPDRFHRDYDADWAESALGEAAAVSSRFEGATSVRGWAGLYAMTPDHHPIIEETIPGFINACGFSGHGFMQSPATGELVSELIADGAASSIDVSRLTNDRFERGEALHETFYSA